MNAARWLMVVADDYGIGPETSRGIVELAQMGVVTGTVLLTNSPHAEDAVRRWRAVGPAADLGWHPCLTMDRPLCRPEDVPTLVGPHGRMGPLRWFLPRLLSGRIRAEDIRRELLAQYERFRKLTGQAPGLVNAHHHVAAFPPVGSILREVLHRQTPLPFLRRVREPWGQLLRISGARLKRATLTLFGRPQGRRQESEGFPGADCMAGIGSPSPEPDFFIRWLGGAAGRMVELMCHPGWPDPTLPGRDLDSTPPGAAARTREREFLALPDFGEACRRAGIQLIRPTAAVTR
jgi:predicted glycoside hydrolase/deacetylase ChbG (UPF0249 family)